MQHRVSRAVRLNLDYKLSDDAACKVTSDGIDELDKVDMMISFVRNGSDHGKRYITLMANLSYSCSLHLHTQGIRNFPSECVSQVGVRDAPAPGGQSGQILFVNYFMRSHPPSPHSSL